MRTTYYIFVLTLTLFFSACSKDNEEDNTGFNLPGNGDPCGSIECLNGGYCSDGTCICPEGFTGVNCGELDLNVTIRINSISISGYPQTTGGNAWDDPFFGSSSTADPYWRIVRPNGDSFESSIYFPDVNGGTMNFGTSSGLPFTIFSSDVDNSHTIQLIDLDSIDASDVGSADDVMVSKSFVPEFYINDQGNEFPSSITLTSGPTTFVLGLSYVW
jgi:hypothetical protein